MCKVNTKIQQQEENCDILTRIKDERNHTATIESLLEQTTKEINKEETKIEWKSYSY